MPRKRTEPPSKPNSIEDSPHVLESGEEPVLDDVYIDKDYFIDDNPLVSSFRKGAVQEHEGAEKENGKRFSEINKTSIQIPEDVFSTSDYAGSSLVEPPFDLAKVSYMILKNPWHYSCISAIVRSTVKLGYKFVLKEAMKENKAEYRKLLDRFELIEKEESLIDILEAVMVDFESCGNGYIEISRDRKGRIDGFYHIPALTVRIASSKDYYVQQRNGQMRFFAPFSKDIRKVRATLPELGKQQRIINEIIHLRNYNPLSDYYGIPPIISALRAFIGDTMSADFNLQFFENNAVPQYAVTITGGKVTDNVKREIAEYFRTHIKGNNHATLIIPLPSGMQAQFTPLSTATKEASFLLYRKMNREEICAVHGVPPSEAGIWEQAIKANSEVASSNFKLKVVKPLQRKLEHKLNLLIKYGLGVKNYEFEFELLDYGDEKVLADLELVKANIRRIDIASGYKTINECRAEFGKSLGLQPLEWGDMPPQNMVERVYDSNEWISDPNNRDDINLDNRINSELSDDTAQPLKYDAVSQSKVTASGAKESIRA